MSWVSQGMRLPAGRAVVAMLAVGVAAPVSLEVAVTQPAAAAGLSFVANYGSLGSGSGQFNQPTGVAVSSTGQVFVADTNNDRIVSFDPSNFGGTFTTFGGFSGPTSVAVPSATQVLVADQSNDRIVSFNPFNIGGTFNPFGSFGSGNGQFSGPNGVAVSSTGHVLVTDQGNNRIVSFDPNNFSGSFNPFGSSGSGNGQFSNPIGIAVSSTGQVFVGDFNNNRIVELAQAPGDPVAVPVPPAVAGNLLLGALVALKKARQRQAQALTRSSSANG